MDRFLACAVELVDLGAAAEAVSEDYVVGRRLADGGQQHLLSARLGDLEVTRFETEVPSQPTTTGIERLDRRAGLIEQAPVNVPPHDRVVMTVHLGDPAHTAEVRRFPSWCVLHEQLRQCDALVAEAFGVNVITQ